MVSQWPVRVAQARLDQEGESHSRGVAPNDFDAGIRLWHVGSSPGLLDGCLFARVLELVGGEHSVVVEVQPRARVRVLEGVHTQPGQELDELREGLVLSLQRENLHERIVKHSETDQVPCAIISDRFDRSDQVRAELEDVRVVR